LELLLDAIKTQDAAAFEKHLAAGTDVNGQDKLGWRPLDRAINVGSVEFTKRLIEVGADVNRVDQEGTSPLDIAISRLQTDIVEVLLKAGARPRSEYPLFSACAVGNLEMFNLFLEAGYDANERSPEGLTPLMQAAQALSPEIVRVLIERGADVNACNQDGWTALFNAVFAPSVKFSQIKYQGGSKLMWAEAAPNPNENPRAKEVVTLLLDNGADVNHRNKDGRTSLTYAGSPEMAEVLVQAGAKLDIHDKRGHDVSYWLKKNGLVVASSSAQRFSTAPNMSAKHPLERRSSKGRRQ
jgi:ankyrin repeat protein